MCVTNLNGCNQNKFVFNDMTYMFVSVVCACVCHLHTFLYKGTFPQILPLTFIAVAKSISVIFLLHADSVSPCFSKHSVKPQECFGVFAALDSCPQLLSPLKEKWINNRWWQGENMSLLLFFKFIKNLNVNLSFTNAFRPSGVAL